MKKTLLSIILIAFIGLSTKAQTTINAPLLEIGNHQINKNSWSQPTSQNNNSRAITSLIQLNDSVLIYSWDTLSNGWDNTHPIQKQINIVYDSHNNLTSYLVQNWTSGAWVNSQKYTYTYDANNNETGFSYQNWVSGAWVNASQSTYTYDTNNNRIGSLTQDWVSGAWVNYKQYTRVYNGNNKIMSESDQSWISGAWVNSSQTTYTYDANFNNISTLIEHWVNGAWVNSQQNTNFFDINNNRIEYLIQGWSVGSWFDVLHANYIYNTNNRITSFLVQQMNGIWVNYNYGSYTYDANNFAKSYEYKYWNTAGTSITSGDSLNYYFQTTTGINNLMTQEGSIKVYPNPFTTKTTILFDKEQKNTTIKIMNMLGKEIKTINFTGRELIIEKAEMQAGIYFIQIIDDNKNVVNRKIVVQ